MSIPAILDRIEAALRQAADQQKHFEAKMSQQFDALSSAVAKVQQSNLEARTTLDSLAAQVLDTRTTADAPVKLAELANMLENEANTINEAVAAAKAALGQPG